jgi:hypothetical protein
MVSIGRDVARPHTKERQMFSGENQVSIGRDVARPHTRRLNRAKRNHSFQSAAT